VKARDRYRCTQPDCATPGRGYGGRLIAGHIVPRDAGGADHPSNIRTFCPTCDNRWHAEKGN
jgi:5-methylcytosine-specific restriction endonuclease McrA